MEQNTKEEKLKPKNYCSGIVKLPPRPPKSAEEIQQAMEEMHDAQFDANVIHVGRRGNIVLPMD
ncbi:MAG: hypothetical protein WCO66_02645 [Candidatus Absconditabacteria bacterium]